MLRCGLPVEAALEAAQRPCLVVPCPACQRCLSCSMPAEPIVVSWRPTLDSFLACTLQELDRAGQAKPIIFPADCPLDSCQSPGHPQHDLYIKSHGAWAAGEQRRRHYDWARTGVDPASHAFGERLGSGACGPTEHRLLWAAGSAPAPCPLKAEGGTWPAAARHSALLHPEWGGMHPACMLLRPSPSTSASCPLPTSGAGAARKAGRHLTCLLGCRGHCQGPAVPGVEAGAAAGAGPRHLGGTCDHQGLGGLPADQQGFPGEAAPPGPWGQVGT